ncbi:helix-turn-helix transcriptional regulator [Dysgonomonas sp. HGC4]|uniref:helix-turn-helix transcriptional regulator n=1 Tax=Dysgonomonas sp. HGC4 TaxID=1658009 RepID=UPI001F548EC7|nr:WYL domain-containing protein [Dysgonomonas sp. HGC4]
MLKEYRNRWVVFGRRKGSLINLALDRIHNIEIAGKERFIDNNLFDSQTFFSDVIGVTKNIGMKTETVHFWVDQQNAPYVQTKPFHKSQKLIETQEDGCMIFELNVVINQELQREFFGFADTIKILSPQSLVDFMAWKFRLAKERYNDIGE